MCDDDEDGFFGFDEGGGVVEAVFEGGGWGFCVGLLRGRGELEFGGRVSD